MSLRVAVVGIDHLHIFELVQGLLDAGVETVRHVDEGEYVELYTPWRTDSVASTFEEILADESIDLVVTAAVPSKRAGIAIRALEANKSVLADKPGVTTREDLDQIRSAVADSNKSWTVLFTERWENRAIYEAVRLARSGEIGEVVSVDGSGPHTLAADSRPEWFFDSDETGGILVDLGSHQIDQFLAITGDLDSEVVVAATGNVTCPDRPKMEDIGSFRLASEKAIGEHRVDYLSPAALGTWGDVRLSIVGTAGTLEARANIDVTGADGEEHLILVTDTKRERIDCSGVELDWAKRLSQDLADGGDRLMGQDHIFRVSELSFDAREAATNWTKGA